MPLGYLGMWVLALIPLIVRTKRPHKGEGIAHGMPIKAHSGHRPRGEKPSLVSSRR
jgi:hypothetical protein